MLHSRRVRQERSHWRDTSLSLRHRQWGWDCPATDIDFLEYDYGFGVALCEWKHEWAAPYKPNDASMRARRNLANQANIPFFVIIRANDLSWIDIVPENKKAEEIMIRAGIQDKPYRFESEIQFVDFLYWLRGRSLPKDVAYTIMTKKFVNRRPLDDLRDVWSRADHEERMKFIDEILGAAS